MPNDYISKSALEDEFSSYPGEIGQEIYDMLHMAPTLDLVPAPVKCGECIYWADDGFGKMCCGRVGVTRKPDFYCANGKRKDCAK